MKISGKTTLLFDFDGTLADSLHHLLQISNRLADEYGYKKVEKEEIASFREKTIIQAFSDLKVPLLKVPAIASRVKREFHRDAHLAKPYSELRPLLAELRMNYRMGILTSNNAANVRRFLAANDLPGFHFIYTSRNIFGKSRVLRRILRQERLLHREVLFIGDEIRDVEAGKKLQIDTVAVCWGVNSKKALQSAGPDYIIDHPADLTSLLL